MVKRILAGLAGAILGILLISLLTKYTPIELLTAENLFDWIGIILLFAAPMLTAIFMGGRELEFGVLVIKAFGVNLGSYLVLSVVAFFLKYWIAIIGLIIIILAINPPPPPPPPPPPKNSQPSGYTDWELVYHEDGTYDWVSRRGN